MSKPVANNVLRIPTSLEGKFFKHWFEIMRPYHHLTDKEIEVAVEFVKERYNLSKGITDEGILDQVLLSEETKKKIRTKLDLKPAHFQVIMGKFKKTKVIDNNRFNPKFVPNITEEKGYFQLLFIFELN